MKDELFQTTEGRAHLAGRRAWAKACRRKENGDKGLKKGKCNEHREPGEPGEEEGATGAFLIGRATICPHLPDGQSQRK